MSRSSHYILCFVLVLLGLNNYAQSLSGDRGGNTTTHHSCGFDHKHDISMQDTNYQKLIQSSEQRLITYLSIPRTRSSNDIYTIPVVVHVLHTGESIGSGTNISDAQIQSSIDNLNDVYRGRTINSPVDFEIEFALAQQDPNCNAHTGINRINASSVPNYTSKGVDYYGDGGEADENTLKDLSRWPETEYFNIWIVNEIENNDGGSGIQGYANFFTGSAYEGSVMLANEFGYDPNNTQGFNLKWNRDNATVIHEFGHYFHLHHTFKGDGDANNDGIGDACPADITFGVDSDGCSDTEPHKRYTSQCKSGQLNDCTGATFSDNTAKNYMSYASCQDRLTNDQKNRCRALLATSGLSLVYSKGDEAPVNYSTNIGSINCSPQTSATGLGGLYTGIKYVTINGTFSNASGFASQDGGYTDYTSDCQKVINVFEDSTYYFEISTLYYGNDIKGYIDYNNDGDFSDANEEIFSLNTASNQSGDYISSAGVNVTIPSVNGSSVISGNKLRFRVSTEITGQGIISGACYAPTYGQVQDFTLIVNEKVTNNSGHTSWNGSSNSNWNDPSNWSSGVPNSSTNVTISNVSNSPIVNTSGAECANLIIENGGLLTVNNSSYNLTTLGIDINSGGQLAITNGEVNTDSIEHTGVLTITGGTLDINGPYHSNGNITTNISGGTIEIEGNWDASSGSGFDPSGGTVVFNGTDQQTISLAAGNNFHDLTINNSNANNKVSAQGSALVVTNHLNITDGIFESASDYHDVTIASGATLELTGDITVSGNWTNNGTFVHNNHTVTFDGSADQTISGNSYNHFQNLTVNKSSGEIITNSSISIFGSLDLTSGLINKGSPSFEIQNSATVVNASNTSHYYNGQFFKWFNSLTPFTYPCGDGTNYRPITLASSSTNSNIVSVGYLFATPNQSSVNSSISSIETYGWDIQRSSGSDGFNITIPFDASYSITDFNNLTIAMYNGTEWIEVPSTVTGTSSSGSITTNSTVSDFSNRYFALGYKASITDLSNSPLVGTWKLSPVEGALKSGSSKGLGDYWMNTQQDVITRACLFDDSIKLEANGTMTHYMDGNTWLFCGGNNQCGTPISPNSGGTFSWNYLASNSGTIGEDQLIVSGIGAHFGTPYGINDNESCNGVDSIVYNVTLSSDSNILYMDISSTMGMIPGYWTYIYQRTSYGSVNNTPKTYVPDDNFEAYLETHDASGNVVSVGDANSMGDGIANNDYVTTANISGVTFLDISSQNIADLTGLEDFSSLQNLSIAGNSISRFEMINNNVITNLEIYDNASLSYLNLSGCTNLVDILTGSPSGVQQSLLPLDSVILTNCTNLSPSGHLELSGTIATTGQISYLNISGCSSITNCAIHDNQISNLIIDGCSSLTNFDIRNNLITSLEITNNSNLNSVQIYGNPMTKLDLSGCTNFSLLHLHNGIGSTTPLPLDSVNLSG